MTASDVTEFAGVVSDGAELPDPLEDTRDTKRVRTSQEEDDAPISEAVSMEAAAGPVEDNDSAPAEDDYETDEASGSSKSEIEIASESDQSSDSSDSSYHPEDGDNFLLGASSADTDSESSSDGSAATASSSDTESEPDALYPAPYVVLKRECVWGTFRLHSVFYRICSTADAPKEEAKQDATDEGHANAQ